MRAVDTNLLVYAHRRDVRYHSEAFGVLRSLTESREPFGIPWHCLTEFLSVVTNARRWQGTDTSTKRAVEQVEAWLGAPGAVALGEGPGFARTWSEVMRESGVSGGQVHDARVAAGCLHHGVSELLTADRDFSRFPRLKTRNPLVA